MNETKQVWARYPEAIRIAVIILAWIAAGAVLWGIAATGVFENIWIVSGVVLLGAATTIILRKKEKN